MICINAINPTQEGVQIHIYVHPGASQSVFPSGYNEWRKRIELKIAAEAKNGKANKEIIKTIAEFFSIPPSDIDIVSGKKSKDKTVLITNLSYDLICTKIEESLHGL